ncbi:MAG: hypothetical protein Q4P84_09395, partial [Elusimicrobiales bacterium]|nr:hypothetical protein [Elusimicrobiales bacterium]
DEYGRYFFHSYSFSFNFLYPQKNPLLSWKRVFYDKNKKSDYFTQTPPLFLYIMTEFSMRLIDSMEMLVVIKKRWNVFFIFLLFLYGFARTQKTTS